MLGQPYRCGSGWVGLTAGRWWSRSCGERTCEILYERLRTGVRACAHGRRRAGAGVGAHGRACMGVYLFCVSRIKNVLSESVKNETNSHELTTNPTKTKQSLTNSKQQRTTKQSHAHFISRVITSCRYITKPRAEMLWGHYRNYCGHWERLKKRGRFFCDIGFLETSKNTIGFCGDITETEKPPPRRVRAPVEGRRVTRRW